MMMATPEEVETYLDGGDMLDPTAELHLSSMDGLITEPVLGLRMLMNSRVSCLI